MMQRVADGKSCDMKTATPKYIEAVIKVSKNDLFRKVVTISMGAALCPVAATCIW